MNRKIKFRAWDKHNKCWYKPIYEAYKGNLYDMLLGLSGGIHIRTLKGFFHESIPEYKDRYELMQFTGLSDKNGKEIYEGDIIFNDDRDEQGIVMWSDQKAMFVTDYGEREIQYPLWQSVGNLYEVIGNIYQK